MSEHATEQHRPWIPAGTVLLLTSAALAATALSATGTARTVAAAALIVLAPAATAIGTYVVRRRYRKRIALLESTLDEEGAARAARDRVYVEFTRELADPLTRINDLSPSDAVAPVRELVQQVENLAIAAQIEARTYRPQFSVVRLDLQAARVAATTPGCRLNVTTDTRPATVWADSAAIRQILLNILHVALRTGATTARVDVEEHNGLGILSITDDRLSDRDPEPATGGLLGSGEALSRRIIPALAEHQGATTTTVRTLGWTNTILRFPVATPAQVATMRETPGSLFDPSRLS